jgi:hypothetical protein
LAARVTRGLLQKDIRPVDPAIAAHQFAWLILGARMGRGPFLGTDAIMTDDELDHAADAGVTTFLAAYGSSRLQRASAEVGTS